MIFQRKKMYDLSLPLMVKGIILGISIAAPVGPIGALCIQQSLQNGFLIGLFCGLGAAFADACYGAIAGFGLRVIQDFLLDHKTILGLIGGLFLCYLGIRTFFTSAHTKYDANQEAKSLGYSFISTFFLTLTNPMTILSFSAILANFTVNSSDMSASLVFVAGVLIGSSLWWLLLCGGVSLFRERINPKILASLNKISGIIIFAFGIQSIGSLVTSFFYKCL